MKIKCFTIEQHWRNQTIPQLKMQNGKLVSIDGSEPDLTELPNGEYTIVQRSGFMKLVNVAMMMQHWTS